MKPTSYDYINNLLAELLAKIQDILEKKLIGLYLYGSLVWGDFDPEISDIDLVAALSSDVNEEDFDRLKTMHDNFAKYHPEWNDRIEVQYISIASLKTFSSSPHKGKLAAISPGDPFHMKVVDKGYLMNWYSVREKGAALFGPDPKTIIEPISKQDFIGVVREHSQNWLKYVKDYINSRPGQAYSILTMCRALYAVKNQEQVSKKKAALWTINELPEWSSLIQNAINWRRDIRGTYELEAKGIGEHPVAGMGRGINHPGQEEKKKRIRAMNIY